ncbi:Chromosome partition protein Smc [Sulfuracidifex tepidarius]|uniref:Chromosome partition protein Smc n=3 Tax=Sulfuracidifex tepidarius TaxID=1294262 RepID=A0A510DS77_9CREN|nr:hypothetical protein [Sulfuracidifex tepidarius]BBG23039.1 Chromosome partition protein Smc [Sulfuracidifex tepidarius]
MESLKKDFLELLEKDNEFRLTVMGYLGFKEIIDRLNKLDEKFDRQHEEIVKLNEKFDRQHEEIVKLNEKFDRHEEEIKKIWEELKKLNEKFDRQHEEIVKLNEKFDRHEEEIKKIWEELKKLNEKFDRQHEEIVKLNEKFDRHEEEIKKLRIDFEEQNRKNEVRFSRIEQTLGDLTEATISRFFLDDLKEEIRDEGDKIISRKRRVETPNGEVDLVVETSRSLYIVEVKVRPRRDDISSLASKTANLISEKNKVAILAGTVIKKDLYKVAEKYGVRLYEY